MKELADVKEQQFKDNLLDLKKGNIITIHLHLKKTAHGFEKQRRQFNDIATFIRYEHGNVICELLKQYQDIKIVEVPIYYTNIVANSIETLKEKYLHCDQWTNGIMYMCGLFTRVLFRAAYGYPLGRQHSCYSKRGCCWAIS
ncbi:MAG: hypothetical protein EZS28_022181 [Streblomastix strix]|uniref:Uncharacterized protein n=1 Tax=Streblomastix strix TaxID=222440 RepID=A0A5J4VIG0_9EUKA|nr:MAG: hypothetical protein EZS28_022181 [Streblomastix strix]